MIKSNGALAVCLVYCYLVIKLIFDVFLTSVHFNFICQPILCVNAGSQTLKYDKTGCDQRPL
jgi:hypothetical protein